VMTIILTTLMDAQTQESFLKVLIVQENQVFASLIVKTESWLPQNNVTMGIRTILMDAILLVSYNMAFNVL